jgi:hypothetical protein
MNYSAYNFLISTLLVVTTSSLADNSHWYTYYRYSQTSIQQAPINPYAMLTIDAQAGNIEIVADQTDTIIVEITKRAVTQAALKNLESVLQLGAEEAHIVTTYVQESFLNGSLTGIIDYVIRVPRAIHIPRINAATGAITVTNVQGVIGITSGTGAVTLNNISGAASVSTTAGTITISCASDAEGIIEVSSNAGIISITGARGSVRASSSAGSISLVQKELPSTASINLETTLGTLSVTLPATVNTRLNAATNLGSFNCAFPIKPLGPTQQGWFQKDIQGILGKGGSAIVKLTTTTGSIEVLKN